MTFAAIITFVICYIVSSFMEVNLLDLSSQLPKYTYEFTKIAVVGTLCLVLYVGLNLLFKMEYASELTKRVLERFKK